MFSKVLSRFAVSVLGWVFFVSLCIGIPGAIANDDTCEEYPADCTIYGCPDDCKFTTDFRLEECKFKNRGINPYFILKPGYRLVLETPEDEEEREKSVETVLCDTKWINLDGRWIKTRVVEERAFEWDEEEGEWVTIEISLNYFAICKKTNAVYYFGEFSRDCPEGFDENDFCTGVESTVGSWEAGKPPMDDPDGVIAKPGLIMSGTPLRGARYFQEMAPPAAVDRGKVVATGLTWPPGEDLDEGKEPEFTGCINIIDTNPAEGACGNDDSKIYCPKVGLVQDQDLKLVWYGFVGCNDDDDDDDDDNEDDGDDDEDDSNHDKRWRWRWR